MDYKTYNFRLLVSWHGDHYFWGLKPCNVGDFLDRGIPQASSTNRCRQRFVNTYELTSSRQYRVAICSVPGFVQEDDVFYYPVTMLTNSL